MSTADCSDKFLTVRQLVDLLVQTDPDMVIAIQYQGRDSFDIGISETYNTILERKVLVLEPEA